MIWCGALTSSITFTIRHLRHGWIALKHCYIITEINNILMGNDANLVLTIGMYTFKCYVNS